MFFKGDRVCWEYSKTRRAELRRVAEGSWTSNSTDNKRVEEIQQWRTVHEAYMKTRLQYWTAKSYTLRSYNIYIYKLFTSSLHYSHNQIALGTFWKGEKKFPQNVILALYVTRISRHGAYYLVFWLPASKKDVRELEKEHRRAGRIILGKGMRLWFINDEWNGENEYGTIINCLSPRYKNVSASRKKTNMLPSREPFMPPLQSLSPQLMAFA